MPGVTTFRLTLRPLPVIAPPTYVRLRRLLKSARRRFGFCCELVEELRPGRAARYLPKAELHATEG